ncbi:hypothetical protein ElyMa_001756900 [Elysia marginata]|uniref:Uncharacterized protein n=1 Tax=Elysia marginata TaxID=1093978 RepID=A0AAV4EBS2_9GAST|nr:hypothetical protein ElyMa_001756900 [Elysia marginata]
MAMSAIETFKTFETSGGGLTSPTCMWSIQRCRELFVLKFISTRVWNMYGSHDSSSSSGTTIIIIITIITTIIIIIIIIINIIIIIAVVVIVAAVVAVIPVVVIRLVVVAGATFSRNH